MKLSLGWIGEHVAIDDLAVEDLAARLTAAGHAVEGVEEHPGGDVVFDCDLTTNRPDAMCHRGLARELGAVLGRELVEREVVVVEGVESAAGAASITIEAGDGCATYHARVITGVRVGPSPPWLAARLEAIGARSINNVVDVTNFVLWELGQPLHAFDLDAIPDGAVFVRRSRAGERLVTLDSVERELAVGTLVIADRNQPIALAGVMGGQATEVQSHTTTILLEGAFFDPAAVRATCQATGLNTDASHRYTRGADPEAPARAIDRAAALIVEVAGGEVAAGRLVAHGDAPRPAATIALAAARIQALGGIEIPDHEVERILRALGCRLEQAKGGWLVTAPSWRRFDFEEEADLIEDVLRVHGFDRIVSTLPAARGGDAPEQAAHRCRRTARSALVSAGFVEAINYGFQDAAADQAWPGLELGSTAPLLANPLSERLAVMRRAIAPGLLTAARFNRRRGATSVRLFEIGHTFWRDGAGVVGEADSLAIVVGGRYGSPWQREVALDIFDAKGAAELVAESLGVELLARPGSSQPGLDPDCAADFVDGSGAVVGFFGRVADDEDELFVAELRLDRLAPRFAPPRVVAPGRFPAVDADLTLGHRRDVGWAEIDGAIRAAAVVDLVSFAHKDRYQGPGVAVGTVNTTISFRYQSSARSLTQEEVNERHLALAADLRRRFAPAEETR